MKLQKNDEIELVCTDLSDQGFGIGHVGGMTVFVNDLLPDETARVRIIKTNKTWAIGKVIERLKDNPDRIQPVCASANACGGCALMHLTYPAQLKRKEKQLKDLFLRVDDQMDLLPPIGMEDPLHYRNKAQFPIGVKNGKVVGGFYKPRSNTIVPIQSCAIQSDTINRIYQWILEHLNTRQAESLRHVLIRDSFKTGEVLVVLIGPENLGFDRLAKALIKDHPEVVGVIWNKNDRKDNVILGDEYEVLEGRDSLHEKCLDLDIDLHFKSFFQVNPIQMEKLYTCALQLADLQPTDRVIELYSGTGTIGLLASRKAKEVIGVEIVPEAVENAKANARANQIENAQFVCMDASEFAAQNSNAADVVLVDPPRKGMSEQGIRDIVRLSPRKVVYISCNPRTLARDLAIFKEDDYRCKVIQPVDMFPYTTGMECVALLEKRED